MDDTPPPALPAGRASLWTRVTRSRRGAAGIGIVAAALLLWPFSEWSAIPWLAGLVVLVLLALLRLDRLLGGWSWHVAGLVVVAGLMWSTSPWAWALAGSIGVLLAGLLQLPAWRLAAAGAVLCLVSGTAFALVGYRTAEQAREEQARAGDPLRAVIGEAEPSIILPVLIEAVRAQDEEAICRLLTDAAAAQLLGATGTSECSAAVAILHSRADPSADEDEAPTPMPEPGGFRVDGCGSPWATAAGDAVGQLLITRTASELERYAVAGFAPC